MKPVKKYLVGSMVPTINVSRIDLYESASESPFLHFLLILFFLFLAVFFRLELKYTSIQSLAYTTTTTTFYFIFLFLEFPLGLT